MEQSILRLSDYTYELPDDRIALYPLPSRSHSKLLKFQKGSITHHQFSQLPDLLPDNTALFFNNTKVIPARFTFTKDTGATIEVFLLQPISPSPVVSTSLETKNSVTWACTIGNLKRWPDGTVLHKEVGSVTLKCRLLDRLTGVVELSWFPLELPFANIIQLFGYVPLPPYLNRKVEELDRERYQTVYSIAEGAVAAPTAGLHFTSEVIQELEEKGIPTNFLTLHVSAGTFLPVKSANALDHTMHEEQIVVERRIIEQLLDSNKTIVAVGTTTLRTLESMYWYGVKLENDPDAVFEIDQHLPYQPIAKQLPVNESFGLILKAMDRRKSDTLLGTTSIYIHPGYDFKVCRGLITNFHQPGSTLLLLIAAFVGPDWKKIYQEALSNGYRFLSYGDSSLLLR